MKGHTPVRLLLLLMLQVGRRFILIIPRRLCMLVAESAAKVVYWLLGKERRKVQANLKLALSTERSAREIERIAGRVFPNLARTAVDVLRFPLLNEIKVKRLVRAQGFEKLDQALKRGKGVLALSAHLGNWEMVAAYSCLNGYPGKAIAREIYYEPFNEVLVSLRASCTVATIYRDGALKQILKLLKENQIVGILADQDIEKLAGVFVPFMGRPAWTSTAPAKLALNTGACIVPMFALHEGEGYRIVIEEPIFPDAFESEQKPVEALTRKWSDVVEQYVKRYPEQWVWMHNRWKTTPEKKMKMETAKT